VDAVMVGRASVGKPWVFREMRSFLDNGVHAASLTWDEQMALLKQMVYSNVEKLDEYRGILHSRRHLAATPLFKGIPNFRETRIAMLRAATLTELMTILDGINPSDYQR
jgi:tRNA-dihydrouridine synthase